MEPRHFLLLMCTWMLVEYYVRGMCFQQKYLKICPQPLIFREGKINLLTIECSLNNRSYVNFNAIYLGRQLGIHFGATGALLCCNKEPVIAGGQGDNRFRPQGNISFTGTATGLTLTLENPTALDLAQNWGCLVELLDASNTLIYKRTLAFIEAVPYPEGNNIFKVPSKPQYDYEDIVSIKCGAKVRLYGGKISLQIKVQNLNDSGTWVDIKPVADSRYFSLGHSGFVHRGSFLERVTTMHIPVSSIQACSRWYRCVLYYRSTIFHNASVETVVRVKSGTRYCNPPASDGASTPRPSNSSTPLAPGSRSSTDTSHTQDDDYDDVDAFDKPMSSAVLSSSHLIAVVVIATLVVVALGVVVYLVLRRRRRQHSRRSRSSHRLGSERIEVVMPLPPMRPRPSVDPYSTSAYTSRYSTSSYRTDPSSNYGPSSPTASEQSFQQPSHAYSSHY